MASDSLAVDHTGLCDQHPKVFRAGDDLIGIAGSVQEGLMFVDWYRAGRPKDGKPKLSAADFEALVLTGGGLLVCYFSKLVPVEVSNAFWAIGSGAKLAMGAMAMGADPEKAVEVASAYDDGTDGAVTVEEL